MRIVIDGSAPPWAAQLETQLNRAFALAFASADIERATVASLPSTASKRLVLVTDEAGGPVIAFSDGSAWRRVTDRNVVS